MMLLNKIDTCFIIAEAGVNHNGSLERALQLVDAAKEAGADAVKFQTFKPDLLTVPQASKAEYQKINSNAQETQKQMLQSLELKQNDFIELKNYATQKGIHFFSTPFDKQSFKFLTELGLELVKISSGDITNAPLLLNVAQSQLPVIISSGLSTMQDIRSALAVLAFGYVNPDSHPNSFEDCQQLLEDIKTWDLLKQRVIVLHCTTDYPAMLDDINMRALQTIAAEFDLTVGYSDHSLGILVPSVAVACGAKVVEKHLTLDKTLPGPDHKASLNPTEFKAMVNQIRDVEKILGSDIKQPSERELINKNIVRRGIYAACNIAQGENLTADNLITLRPENDRSPLEIWSFHNKPASRHYKKFESI